MSARCYTQEAPDKSPPLIVNGTVVFQAHQVGWIVSGLFTIVATITSFWLINKHLQWYTNKREQRYIVRLLFMVPIYAIISFASFLFWNHSTPLLLIRDCYEAIVLTSFFYLLLTYISPDPNIQRAIFLKQGISKQADQEAVKRGEKPARWVFPLGFIKTKPSDGLYFLQIMKWAVLQYCVIRPVTTLVAVILNYIGLYCDGSWGLGWGYIYASITIIVSISVSVAMYCLIQLYITISKHLAPHKPLLKLFSVKAVVFLTFWQASALSLLGTIGWVKDSKYMTADDIEIGIGALLETFEMMIFAFLHIRAFSYKPYRPSSKIDQQAQRTPRLRSLGNAMDFRETFREIWHGWQYIYDKGRGRESRHDAQALRAAHLENAFGITRSSRLPQHSGLLDNCEKELDHTELDRAERQWLGISDNYDYTLGNIVREKSDGLEVQIERELERRGFDSENVTQHTKQRSWWRNVYNRISQTAHSREVTSVIPQRDTMYPTPALQLDSRPLLLHDLDDLPPEGIIRTYKSRTRPNNQRRQDVRRVSDSRTRQEDHTEQGHMYLDIRNSPRPLSAGAGHNSVDSLFGRIFPLGSSTNSSAGYPPSSGAQSTTTHQTRPQGRLIPTTPAVVPNTIRGGTGLVARPKISHVPGSFPTSVCPEVVYSLAGATEGEAGTPSRIPMSNCNSQPHDLASAALVSPSIHPLYDVAPRAPELRRPLHNTDILNNPPASRRHHQSVTHPKQEHAHRSSKRSHKSSTPLNMPRQLSPPSRRYSSSRPAVPEPVMTEPTYFDAAMQPAYEDMAMDLSRYPQSQSSLNLPSSTSRLPSPSLPRGAQPAHLQASHLYRPLHDYSRHL